MQILRKRNTHLEKQAEKANSATDEARRIIEMKEQECKLMASIINENRNAQYYHPSFNAPSQREPLFQDRHKERSSSFEYPDKDFSRSNSLNIEDELAIMSCSPDSLDSGDESDS